MEGRHSPRSDSIGCFWGYQYLTSAEVSYQGAHILPWRTTGLMFGFRAVRAFTLRRASAQVYTVAYFCYVGAMPVVALRCKHYHGTGLSTAPSCRV
jgi:hypothetical protein